MQIKKAMRTHYRQLRRVLSDQDRMLYSESIAGRVRRLPEIATARELLVYVSSGAEVNTHGLIAEALNAGIGVATPAMDNGAMRWTRLKRFADLDLSLPQPVPRKLDLYDPGPDAPVIVPGIAFDLHGNRLGQGGGDFDRFLVNHEGRKIGIAFEIQVADDLPAEPHDIPMDYLVTEARALRFTD
jgi:5-formyltetrahydrofolate cyclo-ligase